MCLFVLLSRFNHANTQRHKTQLLLFKCCAATARYSVTLFRGEKNPTRPHTHGSNVTLMYWVLSYITNSFLFPCSLYSPRFVCWLCSFLLLLFVLCVVPSFLARRGGGVVNVVTLTLNSSLPSPFLNNCACTFFYYNGEELHNVICCRNN